MVDIIKTAANNYKAPKKHICKYCDRGFVKESTLLAHMCESKRRWEQKDDPHVRLGQQAYIIFFKQTLIKSSLYSGNSGISKANS